MSTFRSRAVVAAIALGVACLALVLILNTADGSESRATARSAASTPASFALFGRAAASGDRVIAQNPAFAAAAAAASDTSRRIYSDASGAGVWAFRKDGADVCVLYNKDGVGASGCANPGVGQQPLLTHVDVKTGEGFATGLVSDGLGPVTVVTSDGASSTAEVHENAFFVSGKAPFEVQVPQPNGTILKTSVSSPGRLIPPS